MLIRKKRIHVLKRWMIKMTKKAKDQKKGKIAEAEDYYQKGLDCWQKDDTEGGIECLQKAVELILIIFKLCMI